MKRIGPNDIVVTPDIKTKCLFCMCEVDNYKDANPHMFLCEKPCPCPICWGISCKLCDEEVVIPMTEKALKKGTDKAVEREKVLQMIVDKWTNNE
jgi:hypothetical protein